MLNVKLNIEEDCNKVVIKMLMSFAVHRVELERE